MTDAYGSARAKLYRAGSHMKEADRIARAFVQAHVHTLPVEADADGLQQVWKLRVGDAPPRTLPLIIGDCLFNLRSALDHLVYEIVPPQDRESCEFPIFIDHTRFMKSGLYKMRGVPSPARDEIVNLQPYQPRHGHDLQLEAMRETLWILHSLNVADKHRALHVVAHGASNLVHTVKPIDGGGVIDATVDLGPYEAHSTNEVLRLGWPNLEAKSDVNPSLEVDVAISDAEDFRSVRLQLWLCYRAVQEAFERVGGIQRIPVSKPELVKLGWG